MLANYEMDTNLIDAHRLTYEEVEQMGTVPDRSGLTMVAPEILYFLPTAMGATVSERLEKTIVNIGGLSLGNGSINDASAIFRKQQNRSAAMNYLADRDATLLSQYKELSGKVDFLDIAGASLCEIIQLEDSARDIRTGFIGSLLLDYLTANPTANFNFHAPDSLRSVERFMAFYAQEVDKSLIEQVWTGKVDKWRVDFGQALNTPKAHRYITKSARDQGAKIARTIPVIIIDPLLSLIKSKTRNNDEYGVFNAENRTIAIDPFMVVTNPKQTPDRPREPNKYQHKLIEAEAKSTLFHELIHAMTNSYYRREVFDKVDLPVVGNATNDNTSELVDIMDLWPLYWMEGMTEKLECALFSEQFESEVLPPGLSPDDEAAWRDEVSFNPQELGSDAKVNELHTKLPGAYWEYRLLIDTMFAKLDWEAAGLTWRQAEQLAFKAFTETPATKDTPPTNQHRQAFIEAINLAAHPGFFMKLSNLEEQYGTELATDILTDPEFDPHEPADLPWLASDVEASRLLNGLVRTAIALAQQYKIRLKLLGAPESIIDRSNQRISELETDITRIDIFKLASEGMKLVLEQRHPARKGPTVAARMLNGTFGDRLTVKLVKRPVADLSEARAAIESWKALNNSP